VQKYGKYPIGHCKIITENFDYNKEYFGLIKCKILPPKNLYIPVLPMKSNGKLVFPLCRTCAEQQNNTPCSHSNDQRALTGTFVSLEVDLAKKYGYKVLEIYEVWQFDEFSQYDPVKMTGGIFTDYINHGLCSKQMASGFPHNCTCNDDKKAYVQKYFDNEGIQMDINKIEKNPGMRQVSKLILNTLWGYFALNTNRRQFKIIHDPVEWQEMLQNDQYIINDAFVNELGRLQVSYTEQQEFHLGNCRTNVIIASFVTSQARIKLYSELAKLQDRVLYFDTDSIFYISRPNEYEPQLGEFLGQFTNEIDPNDGDHMVEFVSAGPKNYAYKLDTGITECTVKGITFNYLTNKLITFETLKEIIAFDKTKTVLVPQVKFSANKKSWTIKDEVIDKTYRYVYDKRVLIDDFNTLPYGYSN
jgi:hypothetical protein